MSGVDWFLDLVRHNTGDVRSTSSVLVVGLGRFGASLATSLVGMGVEVLAIDTSQKRVDFWAEEIGHVRMADGTSSAALQQLGASGFDTAVVAIGTGLEASILTTAALSDLGIQRIWAKAITSEHARILERVGAHKVVFPEKEMGERVARMVRGRVLDYFPIDEGFVLAELEPPDEMIGRSLAESGIRTRFDVTVVCVQPKGGSYSYATSETVLNKGDIVVIAGSTEAAENFAHSACF